MHWLDMIKVRDLMRSEVVTLDAGASLREALATFETERISGAPVVDISGRPIGVLSAFDVAQPQHLHRDRIDDREARDSRGFYDEDAESWADPHGSEEDREALAALHSATVADWMHSGVVHLGPDATLREACQLMTEQGIHRVLVMQNDRLLGLLSTMDVVRYLASGAGY